MNEQSTNTVDQRWIHFVRDVEIQEKSYKCQRCDYETNDKTELYEHRSGFLSRCFRKQYKNRFQSLGDKQTLVEWIDEFMVRMVYLSPFALLLVLSSKSARDNGALIVVTVSTIAFLWVSLLNND